MNYSLSDTTLLVNAIKHNDNKAFKFIYLSCYDMLCAYALNYTGNIVEAEDIVQDVLINFWEKRHKLNIHGSIKSYLYRAVYNKYLDTYRSKKWKSEVLESIRHNALQPMVNDDETIGYSKAQIDAVKRAIENLPAKCKDIFMLSKIQGKKYKEIAIIFDINIKTVENQIGIAFKKLRDTLKNDPTISLFLLIRAYAKTIKN